MFTDQKAITSVRILWIKLQKLMGLKLVKVERFSTLGMSTTVVLVKDLGMRAPAQKLHIAWMIFKGIISQ